MKIIVSILILFNVFTLNKAVYYGKDFLQCSIWGNSHGFNFDNLGFDIQGYCGYTLVSTDCMSYQSEKNIVPFKIEIERTSEDKTILAMFVTIEIYGQVYTLMRGRSLLVNGAFMYKPYKSPDNDVKVNYFGNSIVFNTKFLQVHWDGYEHIDVYLCDDYKGKVCGLCGNADGIEDNDFNGYNRTVALGESKLNKYKDWTDEWQTLNSKTNCQSSYLSNQNRCNQEKYRTNEYCGLITSVESPWSLCLEKLPSTMIEKMFESCMSDMCQFQMNKLQQQKAKCDNFERLSQACYDIGITNFDWRTKAECPIYCSENEYYAITKSCPKSCLNPSGQECNSLVYRGGCVCNPGFVLDSKENCVKYKECGCKTVDGSQIIDIGESYNSEDCKSTYYCESTNSNCATKEYKCNKKGSFCGINEDYRYSCIECPFGTVVLNATCIPEEEYKKLTETTRTTLSPKKIFTVETIIKLTRPSQSTKTTTTPTIMSTSIETTTVTALATTSIITETYASRTFYTNPEIKTQYSQNLTKYAQNSNHKYNYLKNNHTKPIYSHNSYKTRDYHKLTSPNGYNQKPAKSDVYALLQQLLGKMTTAPMINQISTLGVTVPSFTLPSNGNSGLNIYNQFLTTSTQISTLGVTFPTFTFPGGSFNGFTTPSPFTQISTLGVTFPTFTLPGGGNIGQFYMQGFTTPSTATQISTLGVTFPTFTFPGFPGGNNFYGQPFTTPSSATQISTLGVTFPTFTLPGLNMQQFYGQFFTTPSSATQISTLGVTFPTFTLPGLNMQQFYGQFFTTPSSATQISTLGVTFPTFTLPNFAGNQNMAQIYAQFFTTPSSATQISTLGVTFPTFTLPGQGGMNIAQLYAQYLTAPSPFTQVSTLGVTFPTFTLPNLPNGGNMGQFYMQGFTTPSSATQISTLGVTFPTFTLPNIPGGGNVPQFYAQFFTTPSSITQISTLGVTLPSFTIPSPNGMNMADLYNQLFGGTSTSPTQISTQGVTIPTAFIQSTTYAY